MHLQEAHFLPKPHLQPQHRVFTERPLHPTPLLHRTKPPGPETPHRTGSRPEAPGVQGGACSRRIRAPGGTATGSRPRHRRPIPPNRGPSRLGALPPPRPTPKLCLTRLCPACGAQVRLAVRRCPAVLREAAPPRPPTRDPGPQPGRCPGRPLRWPGGRGPPASHVPATAPARVSRRPGRPFPVSRLRPSARSPRPRARHSPRGCGPNATSTK